MNQSGKERSSPAMAERAGELGEQVGRLASLALRRIEAMAKAGMSGQPPLGDSPAPDPATSADASGSSGRSATQRAEELLDGAAERVNQLAPLVVPNLRRFVALAQEETEDIWAEAQEIRRSRRRGSD